MSWVILDDTDRGMEASVLCLFKSGFLLPTGIPDAVQEWREVSGLTERGVGFVFEAETQTKCDVEEAVSLTLSTSRKVEYIGI